MRRATLALTLAACSHRSGEVTHDQAPPEAVRALTFTPLDATAGPEGEIAIDFDVDPGIDAFAIEGTLPDDASLRLRELRDPAGDVVLACASWSPDSAYNLTDACWEYNPVILDFPIVPGQRAAPGQWTATFTSSAAPGTPAAITLAQRPEGDDTADVYAQLLLADGLAKKHRDPALYERTLQHWTDLWADLGVALHARWGAVDIGPKHSEDMGWRETTDAAGALGEMTIVLTELSQRGVLGYVTAVPGPVLPGKDGVLVVDVPAHAGRDGALSPSEADTLGETIAHEALHSAGVYHPADGDAEPDTWDALADTLACADWATCDEELGANLMYWTTVYDEEGRRVPQIELTADQRFVARHWVGAL
jgi:hypothetical protein